MPDSLFTPFDLYCERLGPGFWAEPLNAWSNGSFLVAAWLAWRLARRQQHTRATDIRILIGLTAAIGIGSFLFHTLAVRWAMLADVIPIGVYQAAFLMFYTRRVAGLTPAVVALCLATFGGLSLVFDALPAHWLNGSLTYAPSGLFMAVMGVYHRRAGKQAPWAMLLACGIFSLSFFFRAIDMAVCERLPVGTHALWHLLNGVLLYVTTRAYVLNAPSKGDPS
ncbi:MAG: ceramidase domain-containing protein [Aquabacterium sp.]